MTVAATRGDTGMVHGPCRKGKGIDVAGFTGRPSHNMSCRFPQCRCAVMAAGTTRGDADMTKASPQEAGGAAVA